MKLKKINKFDNVVISNLSHRIPNYEFFDYIYTTTGGVENVQHFNRFVLRKYYEFSLYKPLTFTVKKMKEMGTLDFQLLLNGMWYEYVLRYGTELDKITNALLEEYAPLDNYDKYSTITTTDNDRTETTLGKVTSHMGGTSTSSAGTTTTTEQGDEKTTTTTPSFDVDSTKKTETTTEYSATSPRITTVTPNTTTTTTQVENDNSYTDYGENGLANVKNGSTTVEEHTHGNIGVTTSSKMLEEFVLTRIRYNLWEFIAETYADMFLYLK